MEPEIWGTFPEDLFEFVLARLPVAIIFCFRIVCRQWNNLLTSQRFYQHFDQVLHENPWFYTTFGKNNYGAIYDPFMKRWHCSNITEEVPVLPVSSAGGLVCFRDKSYQDLYVCNPLNQSFKKLPTGSIKICFHLGMTTNGSTGYRVLRLGCNRDYEIYDSITKFWGHLGQIPASIELLGFYNFNPISIGNTLYFMNTAHEGIVSCDTSTGVWAHHLIPAPLLSSDLKLVQCDAWIMLVGMVKENDVAYVCIWELEKMTLLFKEVDRMSCLEFHKGSVYLTCLGDKARKSGGFSLMEHPRVKNMRKSSRVSSVSEVMKPQIWEKFPEDLFEVVLARLSLASIFCFRTVCRQWNNFLTSQSFFQHFDQVSQVNPWFYTTFGNNNYVAVYDPFMKRWYCPSVTQTPERPVLPVSSTGGLVCFYDTSYHDLCVCNPLTRSFKIMPTGSIASWVFSGMTMNGSAGYRVLRLGIDREYEIYDSVTKYWSLGQTHADIMIPQLFPSFSKPVAIGTTLYIWHMYPEGILSCDTSTGIWTQHLFPAPLNTSYMTLVESDGQIMFVGLLTKNDATYVCIWELSKTSLLLKEVDRMKCLEFHKKLADLTCFGNKGWLMLHLQSHNMYHMFTYNIATREWLKVFVPFEIKLHSYNQVFGTTFQPCLTAMP